MSGRVPAGASSCAAATSTMSAGSSAWLRETDSTLSTPTVPAGG